MNQKIFETLEFERIRQEVKGYCQHPLASEQAQTLTAMTRREDIQQALDEVEEFCRLDALTLDPPLGRVSDIRPSLKRLEIQAALNGQELAAILQLLNLVKALLDYRERLQEEEEDFEWLQTYLDQLLALASERRALADAIEVDGSVKDGASGRLMQIRRQLHNEESNIRRQLNQIIKSNKSSYLSDQLVTIRNDRYVLPVQHSYRHAFGGIVHDQSASGQTLYIEPQVVVESNNRLQALRREEKEEIERILVELCASLEPVLPDLASNNEVLGHLDFIHAKFQLAKHYHASKPLLAEPDDQLALKEAYHPYLDAETAVANDIYFSSDYRMIIITGPNTGGKTITLKTVGLLQLMAQSGLFITAKEGSRVEIFADIFADIGDEQSIEQNLSTFSGHMTNIIQILDQVDAKSLVLVDELGSGTDPQEGAALAMAILNRLSDSQAKVMATTHYPELKAFSYEHPASINASVEFNEKTLSPTYRLLIGEPGRSNAIDIASRLGLDQDIVQEARSYLSTDSHNLNDMLLSLDEQRQKFERKSKQLNQNMQKADDLLHDLKLAYQAMREDKEKYLQRAKKEANEIVEKRKKQSDQILQDIRQWQLDQGKSQIKEHQMIDKKKALDDLSYEEQQLKDNKVLKKAKREKAAQEAAKSIEVGDEVKVIPYGQDGVVMEERENNEWVVQMGILKMTLPRQDLKLLRKGKQAATDKQPKASVKASKAKSVASSLDLRGERYDDAMQRLDAYIDAALLANYGQVTIIHGHGTGALRKGVQNYLKRHSRVVDFHFAPYNMGGNGATVVKFKED
ncbi:MULTISPECIES: endonuclease MutS2 [Aerococcus]|uniref:Endonuclease MutS2 n=1 Tax=Aerococcus sanguinicola TaxID=119206 RepID=A0A5N1GPU6_9LACT|nr:MULTISPECIES: endonuclease MutS2 [Aerococcus]KAA9302071.1 endonuclease MutS2 [Aerococcus sanguinicola]MDK6368504.1 endonuclease MutS2 [Aerococcus sp. UMB9870]MDK6679587.1 endonuclease MutS2 [Aerococcus sp. UMB8608]MDK6686431.1 endonuclease MutS2 [Aerococcus sp. UMB8623]MDK6940947.1 endonuclease MutS2 [Aerococcus sp. UMB8487]